jgi:hypothetical protein
MAKKRAGATARALPSGHSSAAWLTNTTAPAANVASATGAIDAPLRVSRSSLSVPAIVSAPRSDDSGAWTTPSTGTPSRSSAMGHGGAALAGQECGDPVMRVHPPAPGSSGAVQHARLLAAPASGQQLEKPIAKHRLDLVVHVRMVAAAARPGGARELGGDHPPGRFDGGRHVRQQRG